MQAVKLGLVLVIKLIAFVLGLPQLLPSYLHVKQQTLSYLKLFEPSNHPFLLGLAEFVMLVEPAKLIMVGLLFKLELKAEMP